MKDYFENLVMTDIVMAAYSMLKQALEYADDSHTYYVRSQQSDNEAIENMYWNRIMEYDGTM